MKTFFVLIFKILKLKPRQPTTTERPVTTGPTSLMTTTSTDNTNDGRTNNNDDDHGNKTIVSPPGQAKVKPPPLSPSSLCHRLRGRPRGRSCLRLAVVVAILFLVVFLACRHPRLCRRIAFAVIFAVVFVRLSSSFSPSSGHHLLRLYRRRRLGRSLPPPSSSVVAPIVAFANSPSPFGGVLCLCFHCLCPALTLSPSPSACLLPSPFVASFEFAFRRCLLPSPGMHLPSQLPWASDKLPDPGKKSERCCF